MLTVKPAPNSHLLVNLGAPCVGPLARRFQMPVLGGRHHTGHRAATAAGAEAQLGLSRVPLTLGLLGRVVEMRGPDRLPLLVQAGIRPWSFPGLVAVGVHARGLRQRRGRPRARGKEQPLHLWVPGLLVSLRVALARHGVPRARAVQSRPAAVEAAGGAGAADDVWVRARLQEQPDHSGVPGCGSRGKRRPVVAEHAGATRIEIELEGDDIRATTSLQALRQSLHVAPLRQGHDAGIDDGRSSLSLLQSGECPLFRRLLLQLRPGRLRGRLPGGHLLASLLLRRRHLSNGCSQRLLVHLPFELRAFGRVDDHDALPKSPRPAVARHTFGSCRLA
mmetsp:Transcript_98181/g.311434  ORF Transcript_98181/g.311434 Transcript_98181/m.311434 type:complete len:334 (-) Transcript_98181:49-1050(-)